MNIMFRFSLIAAVSIGSMFAAPLKNNSYETAGSISDVWSIGSEEFREITNNKKSDAYQNLKRINELKLRLIKTVENNDLFGEYNASLFKSLLEERLQKQIEVINLTCSGESLLNIGHEGYDFLLEDCISRRLKELGNNLEQEIKTY